MIKARSAAAVHYRRRGSVLVLVMTLLGVLFVTGVAFLASMNFEAQNVALERSRDQRDVGIGAALDETVAALRAGLVGDGGAPFGGTLDEPLASTRLGVAPAMLGELPGVHDLFAPIEPYQPTPGEFRFRSYTDLPSVLGSGDPSFAQTLARREATGEVNAAWASGSLVPGPTGPDLPTPVDSDGDGVTDTFQFPMTALGFSKAQMAELSRKLSPVGGSGGEVFLGMRVIAHSGMVNINESHPMLIINALGLDQNVPGYELTQGPVPNELEFTHSPSTIGVKYSPELEEPVLRRRGLLPPRSIQPSRLHGNALLDRSAGGLEFGAADMPTKLFSTASNGELETVFEGAHRYVPFDGLNEEYDPNTPLWSARMEPFASFNADDTGNAYDRRHLVTTVSHDDLLSRGGRAKVFDAAGNVTGDIDLREAMIEVNRDACPDFPFEYADYPQNMEPGGCACLDDPTCRLNARKGRLALSLAWLDDEFPCEGLAVGSADRAACMLRRSRLIQDAFMMLLRNARGAYWDEMDCSPGGNPAACIQIGELCDTAGTEECYDPVSGLSHRESLISRTAASLTANLIDYMDQDGIPTPVELRSFDFSNRDTVGRELGPPANPGMPQQFVFGLERQPYITEVTTAARRINPTMVAIESRAVELYNPYPDDFVHNPGVDEYVLMEVDPADGTVSEVPLQRDILGAADGMFTVFRTDANGHFAGVANVTGKTRVYPTTTDLKFGDRWTIYLVRRVRLPGETSRTDIVVDQFTLDGSFTGSTAVPEGITMGLSVPLFFSLERFIPDPAPPPGVQPQSRWTATVPVTVELALGHTLGSWSGPRSPVPMPVEVNFANTGSFTGFDPVFGTAFPTTGSMLLLMRHANRQFDDRSISTTTRASGSVPAFPIVVEPDELSFTSWLDRETTVRQGFNPVAIREREQIDNGRMPVFDQPVRECAVGKRRCRRDADCTPGDTCEWLVPAAHHADPRAVDMNRPGSTEHLPWGQLLWDYFTVLPLSSQGPYPAWVGPDPPYTPAAADSIPRVDLDGLRVHGRININAAPWMVMSGLPLTPVQRIPGVFRLKIASVLGLRRLMGGLPAIAETQAGQLASDLAMGVAAYREAREIQFATGVGSFTTGDFGDDWRGWDKNLPLSRRGTGFLTVGELANVRHTGAAGPLAGTGGLLRFDNGELDADAPDYVRAIALLASLGDWVTVRSHVFTMYGTLRGEGDITIEDEVERAKDVDKRAVRFQETVDRLPTFLGASRPSRIGQRYVGPYIDVRND